MKINNYAQFLLVIIATITLPYKSFAQSDYEKQTASFSIDLARKIKESDKTKIAVSDFLDNNGNLTELGKAIAEEIGVGIVNESKGTFQVMERSNLNAILAEQKLSSTGLIDPETAKKLGKLKMVDAVIVGNITPFGNSFRVTIKILDTETGMSIAAVSGNLAGTDDIKGLFNKKVAVFNPGAQTNNTDSSTVNTNNKSAKCYKCNGEGTISVKGACIDCKGTGRITCFECNGSGHSKTGYFFPCEKCNGKGYTICTTCGGKKIVRTTEICPICNGTGEINNSSSENSDSKQIAPPKNTVSKDVEGCEAKNTGDYCFTNSTKKPLTISLYIEQQNTGKYFSDANISIKWSSNATIKPGETECFYDIEAIAMKYMIYERGPLIESSILGNIMVEKCKSKTFVIR